MKLNDKQCKNSKPKEKPYKLFDGHGLYLEIMPSGSKLWRLKYRYNNKEKRLSFGNYPLITLKAARDKRDDAKLIIQNGDDPAVVKQEEKALKQLNSANTFEAIAREWLEKRKGEIEDKTLLNISRRLERNLFPRIGKLPIRTINAPILLAALKEIESRGVLDTVKRVRQAAGQIFKYAIASGRADYNPSQDIAEALKTAVVKNLKSMPLEELPNFLRKVHRNDARLYIQTCLALRLMVILFTRKKELTHARWDEFDFEKKVWLIPAERAKMRREHIVPLSKQALAIFQELKEMNGNREFVFPSLHKPMQPMHEDTILRALYKLGYKGEATIHGFRALAMTTIMEELGYRYEVPNLQLAHAKGDAVRKAYDRTQFLDERVKMMQEWSDYVDLIVVGNVISFSSVKKCNEKIYKLKGWYSLNDAARRLSITLNEEISIIDILQMSLEGHLKLSWNVRHLPARKVAKYTKIASWDPIFAAMSKALPIIGKRKPLEYNPKVIEGVIESFKFYSEITYIFGTYELALDECEALSDWILSLTNNTESDLHSFDSYFVRDEDGWLWQMMDKFSIEDLKSMDKDYLDKPMNHMDNYYPRDDYPELEDLGIRKEDIEAFELLLNSQQDNDLCGNELTKASELDKKKLSSEPNSSTKESTRQKKLNNVLKIFYYMAEDKYNHVKGFEADTAKKLSSLSGHSPQTIKVWLEDAEFLIQDDT